MTERQTTDATESLDSIPTRVATVVAVDDVAAGVRQITFGGLHDHRPIGPDDFFLVIVPRPGFEHQLDGEVSFEGFRALPEDEAPAWAYYTARRWHAERGELDAWFVLHDHEGAVSGWARRSEVGARVALWGPRTGYEPPPSTSSVLLVGDETGLGAFAAIIEATDPSIPIHVVVESDDGRPVVDLPRSPSVEVRWVSRGGAERGTGDQLVAAVAALDVDPAGVYAYGAAESRLVTAVRKHLRHEIGVPSDQVQMIGYWRRER